MNLMVLIKFINKYSASPKIKILLYSIFSGVSYALALAVINAAMLHVSTGNDILKIGFLLLFVTACLLHTYFKRYSVNNATKLAANIIRNVREDITGKIRCSELGVIEKMGKGSIYTRLTDDAEAISQSAPMLILALESLFSLCACLFYIIYLSFYGFLFIICLVLIMAFIYMNSSASASNKLAKSVIEETDFFDRLNDVLFGFKEIRINYKKNRDLFADVVWASEKTAKFKTDAYIGLDNSLILMLASYLLILIGTLFIFPVFEIMEKDLITRLVSSLLFLWGPMVILLMVGRNYIVIMASITNIKKLEAALDNFNPHFPDTEPVPPADFTELALNSVEFCYKNKKGDVFFKMGPIDFSFKKGEIIFITGGNGSGKSTLMKLLTGLYYPEPGGAITIGAKRITSETYPSYRELFSTIFTDFHIFEKLYGLKDVDENKVNDLLRQMEIDHKTEFIEEKFTNINLSTGQRKRLAYIMTLLEDKQVYVFDEWAADQDPEFRKNFYNKFLNDMRAIGKTVIAVSHDDRYFHTADRIVKLEEGKTVTP